MSPVHERIQALLDHGAKRARITETVVFPANMEELKANSLDFITNSGIVPILEDLSKTYSVGFSTEAKVITRSEPSNDMGSDELQRTVFDRVEGEVHASWETAYGYRTYEFVISETEIKAIQDQAGGVRDQKYTDALEDLVAGKYVYALHHGTIHPQD